MKKQNILIGLVLVMIFINLTSCAPNHYSSDESGFFAGIWHGFVFIFALIGKLFGLGVGLYAENNSGFFYWLGFIIGIGGLGGGGVASRR